MGVGAKIFNGFYDNTDVAKKIMSLLGAKAKASYRAANQAGMKIAAN
jgi:alkaline phosphatase